MLTRHPPCCLIRGRTTIHLLSVVCQVHCHVFSDSCSKQAMLNIPVSFDSCSKQAMFVPSAISLWPRGAASATAIAHAFNPQHHVSVSGAPYSSSIFGCDIACL